MNEWGKAWLASCGSLLLLVSNRKAPSPAPSSRNDVRYNASGLLGNRKGKIVSVSGERGEERRGTENASIRTHGAQSFHADLSSFRLLSFGGPRDPLPGREAVHKIEEDSHSWRDILRMRASQSYSEMRQDILSDIMHAYTSCLAFPLLCI